MKESTAILALLGVLVIIVVTGRKPITGRLLKAYPDIMIAPEGPFSYVPTREWMEKIAQSRGQ